MGGVDKDNATSRVLSALDQSSLPSDLRITVVMGPHAPWLGEVKGHAARMRVETRVRVGVRNMAQLMADSDLAIGAAGGTSWERCCLGLPTFVLCLADNQLEMVKSLRDAGAIIATTDAAETALHISEYFRSGQMEVVLAQLSTGAAGITDGRGSERACRRMMA